MNEELEKITKAFTGELTKNLTDKKFSGLTINENMVLGITTGLFAKHVAPLLAEIERLKKESKWVSVEEPPEFGETVLVYCKIYGRFLATYEYIGEFNGEKYGNWRDFKGNLGILPPVWWMKIDEPPVEKS